MADDPKPTAGLPCRVYWGHAGCELPRGHAGQHSDLPGHCPFPREGEGLEYVFGEDWHGPEGRRDPAGRRREADR